jgi:hypothetical protein
VLSLLFLVGGIAYVIVALVVREAYWIGFIIAVIGFVGVWVVYWIVFWSVRGFHKIGKVKILHIIKWAAIIFFASILFHLADFVVHKTIKETIKVFEEKPSSRFGSAIK